ncbi:MAG: MerR family transcriptional regulator [Alphaproteobacteria bacterium]|nr:MAG: MerR family transcriptional regulator [Alphaproteobacteria bacterium]
MPHHDPVLSIGAVAEAAGLSTPTIRYYEEIGLIPPARRSPAGHRRYTRRDIRRLKFIRQCRSFGFGLDEVRLLSTLSVSPDKDCSEVRDIAARHLASVRDRLAEMHRLEKQLQELVETCSSLCRGGPAQDCVSLAELASN